MLHGVLERTAFEERELLIYMPPSYRAGEKRYPIVYVQDGGDLFAPANGAALEELERMFEAGTLRELLLVGVSSPNRLDEYSPWPAQTLTGRFEDFGGKGADYLEFLSVRLKPYIDDRYRTERDARWTAIAGKSMGGLISIFSAYSGLGMFGRIGAISPSMWFDGFVTFMREHPAAGVGLDIYLDVGSDEGVGKPTAQSQMVPRVKEAYALLQKFVEGSDGAADARVKFVLEEGGLHLLPNFIRRFPPMLQWLFAGD
ncbi:alpha/beta hydrolase [Paenibacillus koleovorans]|uniref:alpha/beta hydrolase n=1 Tax=Paenibacillus koleovorans TaxID=121608 RepID=UPI001FEB9B86|nr:alpha/beta hydrolase-fold protein [Paenibacillus koleovorans]